MADSFSANIRRLETEKEIAVRDKEKLQEDTLSYTNFTTQLQAQITSLTKQLNEKEKSIKDLEQQKDILKEEVLRGRKQPGLEGVLPQEDSIAQENIISEEDYNKLEDKIEELEGVLKSERKLYYYNLGTAYVKAEFFNEAIKSYEKALEIDFNNAQAHYNLGLLYENVDNDFEKAVLHYQKYLELDPQAEDKDEVEGWIEALNKIVLEGISK